VVKRFLITTALEATWRDDEPVLFLGEWCRLYHRQDRWSALDAEVLPYHWNDRAKLFADYQYLTELHERLLADLTDQLNQIHGVDHRLRYWRILIGPWLGYFVPMLFDRWASIRQAIDHHDLSGTIVLTDRNETLVPNDIGEFRRLFVGDEWNHHIYAGILERFSKVHCFKQAPRSDEPRPLVAPRISWKRQAKRTLAGWSSRAAKILTDDRDAFLLATYLPYLSEMRLHRRLNQVPQLWSSVPPIRVPVDLGQRRWIVTGESRNDFEACARGLIPQQIPTAYLEGYHQMVAQSAGLPWPKRPKVIWTSNSHMTDDVFKAWAAQKVEHGAPLVIGQHGGHYGMGRWSFLEDHEVTISDCYLSWGWVEPTQSKIRPVGQFSRKSPTRTRHARQPLALLVASNVPRQSYWMLSTTVSSQMLDYFQDQFRFVDHLPRKIQAALIVRLYPVDYGWDQSARWRARFPDVRQDDGRSHIKSLIRRSRIYISTYNASTYLESFAMNVPTVMYWDPNQWELRESAIPYFEELKRVGIFHETPESAARHLTAIWDDVDAWWTSHAVRDVLERFMARYCNRPPDLMGDIEQVLRQAMTFPNRPDAP
jgi:putative transferase (TIGR04331 family)